MTKKFLLAVLLVLSAMTLTAQIRVTGKVTDETNSPLPGANVVLKGTMKGVVTDFDGNYTLDASQGDVIEFSYIGYQSQTKNVIGDGSKSLVINVSLKEDAQKLDDVVVIGYGVQKKVNLTGAVSSVKGEALETRPVANAAQSLQGMVSGLYVSNSGSGRPGANSSLNLRGQGNLSNTANPYVLVDGVEMNLADVNPNDIENISVLKDAAASAIYGARAAYGVILVTTKKGQEDKMRVSYQGTVGFHSPMVLPNMVDSYIFAQYWNAGVKNAGSTRLYSDEKMALLQQYIKNPNSVDPWFELPPKSLMNPAFENSEQGVGNVDYFDLHYKNSAIRSNHNLSLSGGNKKAQYYLSGGYYEEDGILRYAKMDFKRYTLTANISSQMTDWLKIKLNSKFLSSQNNTPFGDGGLSEGFYHSLARFRPTVSHIDPHGNFTELTMIPYLQSGTYTTLDKNSLNITAGAELQPLKGWFIFFDYTYRRGNDEYEALSVAPNIYAFDGVTTSKGVRDELSVTPDGRFTRYYAGERYKTMNLYTNYLLTLAEKNNFTFMAGYQEEDLSYSYLKNSTTKLYSTKNPNLGMGAGDKVITDTRYGWATRGVFGRINYDYDGRYLLEVNGRYDGSSRFAKANRWGFFPSVSVGWNISRENFMEETSNFLSNLKLRASYGLLGNQAGADLYTFAATMSLSSRLGGYIFSDGRHSYTQAPKVIDLNTTWEKVASKNIGIDFGLFDNRLTGSFDVFQRDTKDMLGTALSFPDFFGADAPKTNNANMRNRGWELQLNYRGKITEDIDFNIGGMLSDATSVVTKYTNPDGTNPANNWYEGKAVGEIWGYRSSGLIQTQAEADEYNKAYDTSYLSPKAWTPGDVKYINLNGDKKIDRGDNKLSNMGDMTIIGNTTPRYQYTITGGISWKGLALNVMFQGVGKRDWHPGGGSYFWGAGPYSQVHVFKQHLDYWTESNPNAYYPKPYIHSAGGVRPFQNKNRAISDRYIQNAAYCRLKNVTLSYRLSEEIVKRFYFQKVQMFISGENLLTFTPLMDIYDPEVIFTRNTYTGEGGKNYPMNKVVSMGIIVNF